jgi:hypothetical protein
MKNLISPHILLIGNPYSTITNLKGILIEEELEKIRIAVKKEVQLLYILGQDHFQFAKSISHAVWRQKVSRLYYAAYNTRRAVQLQDSGEYSTDVSDHKDIDNLPQNLNKKTIHGSMLKQLRDDRNLADYSHLGRAEDLFATTQELEEMVEDFLGDCKSYLIAAGINL